MLHLRNCYKPIEPWQPLPDERFVHDHRQSTFTILAHTYDYHHLPTSIDKPCLSDNMLQIK